MSVAVATPGHRPTAPRTDHFAAIAARLNDEASRLTLFKRLACAREHIPGRLVFTTSFGIEDQAVSHALFAQDLAIDVVTLDTGRLFPQTYDVWAQTERAYGHRIRAYYPERSEVEALIADQGIDGFRSSIEARQACCRVRKVVPLGRALAGAAGWITGLRGDQSTNRAQTPFAESDPARGLIKLNPLFDWTRPQVADFVQLHCVPVNALHANGFLSIGCAPCTRAIAPGEPERAGRWWWEQEEKKECGLHNNPNRAAYLAQSR